MQFVQDEAPALLLSPAMHRVQFVAALMLKVPAMQAVHAELPSVLACVPPSQALHLD